MAEVPRKSVDGRGDPFKTTHWSIVYAAAQSDETTAREAMAELFQQYWPPLYAYIRRRGFSAEDSQDLLQGFFAMLIVRRSLGNVKPERGRFRAFLLAALKHYLSDERRRAEALKRGGDVQIVFLDQETVERELSLAVAETETPETLFERDWALHILRRAADQTTRQYQRNGQQLLAERLRPYLTNPLEGQELQRLAQELRMTVGTLKVAVHRMRKRYGLVLRDVLAESVESAEDVDAEIVYLLSVL